MSEILLSPAEARVIAALVEKSITTPAYYPMTANGVMLAANQKNNRNPVMALTEGQVGGALNELAERRMVSRDDLAGRVPKWRHQFHHQLLIKTPELAVLVSLMLRGPQTIAELRSHAAPLGGPESAEGVRDSLELLADRAQPLVRELSRAAGQSATRWAQLLCGEEAIPQPMATATPRAPAADTGRLEARIEALEARMAELEAQLRERL